MLGLRLALQRTQAAAIFQRSAPSQNGLVKHAWGMLSQQHVRGMANTKDDGQYKTWKPLAPTLRQRRMTTRKHLHKGGPVRELTIAKRRSGGRNNTGRITCRHRGGGAKRRIRMVDFRRTEPGPQQVVRLEYDPGRSAHIALIKHIETGKLSYILAPANLKPGAVVQSFMQLAKKRPQNKEAAAANEEQVEKKNTGDGEEEGALDYTSEGLALHAGGTERVSLEIGNCMPLKMVPMGSTIHNIGLHPYGRGQIARSAGTWAQLVYTGPTGLAQIKLMSGEIRRVPVDACATLGQVSNINHKHQKLGGAGARRRRGWRPTVRGTAMNTHDHPHGGGRGKSKGNKHPRSPWGKPAKGGKTRRKPNTMVVRSRPRR
ncbi:mitochondrial 54S ribosomal protein rml2 [Coemansia guatemalensis]|uniref:Large ribosomal subunit protein uL2m n=1 Tax=Coemansia guatemalensis TaxID=2761395 RepID=A0A9W8HTW6_9FUNG|nr:mitochondrial 54S ribosomal protein rml2 [Coemansia guatemalensis]